MHILLFASDADFCHFGIGWNDIFMRNMILINCHLSIHIEVLRYALADVIQAGEVENYRKALSTPPFHLWQ